MRRFERVIPPVVLCLGLLFTLYLLTLVRDGVFASGDGGVKFLLVKQLASADLRPDLHLEVEPWARALWDAGLFPLASPFVYALGGRTLLGFPIFFSALSAPFYALLGYPGLYVIPVVALWGTWFSVATLCRQLEFGPWLTGVILFGVIFASPLSLYGVMFWEHTLGVACSMVGVAMLLAPGQRSPASAALCGAMIGLSTWFRPELSCVVLATFAMAALGRIQRESRVVILASMLVTVGLWLTFNVVVYGESLGLHGEQMLGGSLAPNSPGLAVKIQELDALLIQYFPLIVPAVGLIIASRVSKRASNSASELLGILIATLLVFVPTMVPNSGGKQWGPRYLLMVVPAAAMFVGLSMRAWPRSRWRDGAWIAIFVALVWGVYTNAIDGPRVLAARFYSDQLSNTVRIVAEDPATVVAVNQQWVAQELAMTWGPKTYFLTDNKSKLQQLASVLAKRGAKRFLLLSSKPINGTWHYRSDNMVVEMRVQPMTQDTAFAINQVALRDMSLPGSRSFLAGIAPPSALTQARTSRSTRRKYSLLCKPY